MNALNCYKNYPIYTEEKAIAPNIVANKPLISMET